MLSIRQQQSDLSKQIIADGNALAFALRTTDYPWNKFIPQLQDPRHQRPNRPIPDHTDRSVRYHPRKGVWEKRAITHDRGEPQITMFTKKICTTLLPTDGQTKLFSPENAPMVGLLFNASLCDLKDERYIFSENAYTNQKWWLRNTKIDIDKQRTYKGMSFSDLQKHLVDQRSKDIVPNHNEVLAGVSQDALIGVFATCDDAKTRLIALSKRDRLEKELGIHLPIFVITTHQPVREYTKEEQKLDLMSVSNKLYDADSLMDTTVTIGYDYNSHIERLPSYVDGIRVAYQEERVYHSSEEHSYTRQSKRIDYNITIPNMGARLFDADDADLADFFRMGVMKDISILAALKKTLETFNKILADWPCITLDDYNRENIDRLFYRITKVASDIGEEPLHVLLTNCPFLKKKAFNIRQDNCIDIRLNTLKLAIESRYANHQSFQIMSRWGGKSSEYGVMPHGIAKIWSILKGDSSNLSKFKKIDDILWEKKKSSEYQGIFKKARDPQLEHFYAEHAELFRQPFRLGVINGST